MVADLVLPFCLWVAVSLIKASVLPLDNLKLIAPYYNGAFAKGVINLNFAAILKRQIQIKLLYKKIIQ